MFLTPGSRASRRRTLQNIVSAGTYGDSTHVPQLVFDAKGRIIGVTNVAISGGSGGLFSPTLSAKPTKSGTGLTSTLGSGVTVTDVNSGVNFATTGANGGMITSSVPATPYSISVLLAVNNPSQFSIPAFGWSDGTKVQFIYSQYSNVSQIVILGFTNVSTFGSTIQTNTSVYTGATLYWWRIRDDGTNISFHWSGDGETWTQMYTVAKASGYLGSSGYSKIFVGTPGGSGATNLTLLSWTQGT